MAEIDTPTYALHVTQCRGNKVIIPTKARKGPSMIGYPELTASVYEKRQVSSFSSSQPEQINSAAPNITADVLTRCQPSYASFVAFVQARDTLFYYIPEDLNSDMSYGQHE